LFRPDFAMGSANEWRCSNRQSHFFQKALIRRSNLAHLMPSLQYFLSINTHANLSQTHRCDIVTKSSETKSNQSRRAHTLISCKLSGCTSTMHTNQWDSLALAARWLVFLIFFLLAWFQSSNHLTTWGQTSQIRHHIGAWPNERRVSER
jgi:hypothetical protein